MDKHYVGSEIGKLRSVMLHRPNLSLKRLTPSNCQELLFDDVLSVERAGEEHDVFANTLRNEGIEVLLLTDLLTETLDVIDAKAWLLETQVSDYRLGHAFASDVRGWLADMPHRELARRLSGGLTYGEIPTYIQNMVVDTHEATDFIMKPLPNHLFTRDTSCWIYNGVSQLTQWLKPLVNVKPIICALFTVGIHHSLTETLLNITATTILIMTTLRLKAVMY